MKTYDFNYKDNEGDEFQSNGHTSLKEAKAEVERLRKQYDGDMQVTETWIYKGDDFVGRW